MSKPPASVQTNTLLARELFERYESYRLGQIVTRRFTQADMLLWLEPMRLTESLQHRVPSGSRQRGRTISMLTLGKGDVKVLLWSQMHGDEPTATMALLDMLNFLKHGSLNTRLHERSSGL